MNFSEEPFSVELFEEAAPLLVKHYDEVWPFKDVALRPNLALYDMMHKAGALHIFTARDSLDGLRGYATFFLMPSPHHASVDASSDTLFIHPDDRNGLFAVRFMQWCEKRLIEMGATLLFHNTKLSKDFGLILERMGYIEMDRVFARRAQP